MISYMLVHHDISIPCVSPAVYKYLATCDLDKAACLCSVQDIPDREIHEIISKINEVTSAEELSTLLSEDATVHETLSASGWVKALTIENKGYAVQNLLLHEVLIKRKVPLDQLRQGLTTLGVLSLIEKHSSMMEGFFVNSGADAITPEIMIDKVFANASAQEVAEENERARTFFLQSLTTLYNDEKDAGLVKLLMYAVARNSIPPLGLEEKVQLVYRTDGAKTFFAETCTLKLKVPVVHETFGAFYSEFKVAVQFNYKGFGSV